MNLPPGGYAWWYVDALSEDGRFGLTVIAFIGSVFSPYYALARRRGPAEPLNHCALNVALYGPGVGRWCMTERGARQVSVTPERFSIGPSAVWWDDETLAIEIDEIGTPLPRRVRGMVRIRPSALQRAGVILNREGMHLWMPLAPRAAVEVELAQPALRWHGTGYLDHNQGDAPLAEGFRDWHWSRAATHDNTAVFYDGRRRDGTAFDLALRFDDDGRGLPLVQPPVAALPRSGWRIQRQTRSEAPASVSTTLEDTPFYARSLVAHTVEGERLTSVHESLSLDRFASPVVQAMLPFRMPRRE